MLSIFDQPHIFIVYPAGAGGNFVSKVCTFIQNNQLTNIDFPKSGSSHVDVDRKMLGTDFLSFGTLPDNTYDTHHSEQRINNYLENIKLSYDSKPYVAWTHDFSNIPLYKKYFPNSKIIVITQTTDEEKLTVLFMRLLKTHLSDDANKPMTADEEIRFMFIWKLMVKRSLIGLSVPDDIIAAIINDIRNPKYFDIVNYASMLIYLHYYGIASIVESGISEIDITNKMFYPASTSVKFINENYKKSILDIKLTFNKENWNVFPREVKNKVDDYFTEDIVILPYSVITHAQTEEFLLTINKVFNYSLDVSAQQYVKDIFNKYINSQNQLILSNPKQYYYDSLSRYQKTLFALVHDNTA